MLSARISVVCLAIAGIAVIGCSSQEAQVSGTVTIDDQPLSAGTVAFYPQGPGAIAFGQIDSNGRYQLNTGSETGLTPGSYAVTVEATELVPPTPTNPEPIPKLLTPERYRDKASSGLLVEVKTGNNDIPLQLSSKK